MLKLINPGMVVFILNGERVWEPGRDEDPTFFSTDPDPAGKKCGSGSDLKST